MMIMERENESSDQLQLEENYVKLNDQSYTDDLKLAFFYAGNANKQNLSIVYCEITLSELPKSS